VAGWPVRPIARRDRTWPRIPAVSSAARVRIGATAAPRNLAGVHRRHGRWAGRARRPWTSSASSPSPSRAPVRTGRSCRRCGGQHPSADAVIPVGHSGGLVAAQLAASGSSTQWPSPRSGTDRPVPVPDGLPTVASSTPTTSCPRSAAPPVIRGAAAVAGHAGARCSLAAPATPGGHPRRPAGRRVDGASAGRVPRARDGTRRGGPRHSLAVAGIPGGRYRLGVTGRTMMPPGYSIV
jgi:hypothetical protein